MKRFVLASVLLLFPLVAAHAVETVTPYTSLATFSAAANTTGLFTFEGIATQNSVATNVSLSPLGVSVSGGADYYVINGSINTGSYDLNGTSVLLAGRAFQTVSSATITLGGSYTAFATEIGFRAGQNGGTVSNAFTAQLYNGIIAVGSAYASPLLDTGYIGLTSTQAFDRIVFTPTTADNIHAPYIAYDNVRVGTALTVVPEASTGTLFAMTGLLCGAVITGICRRAAK